MTDFERYRGTDDYIASEDLKQAVNVAIALSRPLLLRGEPGTGKTLLSRSIAEALGMRIVEWSVKSTTRAQVGLYTYDAVQRLYDSRFDDKDVSNIEQYIKLGPLGEAFESDEQVVLLIDEVDKADIEFPMISTEIDRYGSLRDWTRGRSEASADCHHHFERGKRTARRFPP